jgi:hypothetical protein
MSLATRFTIGLALVVCLMVGAVAAVAVTPSYLARVVDPATGDGLYRLDASGALIAGKLSTPFIGSGQEIGDISLGPDGRVYVCNNNNAKIYRETSAGSYATGSWELFADAGALFGGGASVLRWSPDGNLYVCLNAPRKVVRFYGPGSASPGAPIGSGFFAAASGGDWNPSGVNFAADGTVVVGFKSDRARYDIDGNYIETLPSGPVTSFIRTEMGPDGDLWAAGIPGWGVWRFDSAGNVKSQISLVTNGYITRLGNYIYSTGWPAVGGSTQICSRYNALTGALDQTWGTYQANSGGLYAICAPAPFARLSETRGLPDGTFVMADTPKAVTVASGVFSDSVVYLEEADRSSGTKAVLGTGVPPVANGDLIGYNGIMRTDGNGQRYIEITSITSQAGGTTMRPLGASQSAGNTTAAVDSLTGLLVRAWGKVTASSGGVVSIDDGTGLFGGVGLPVMFNAQSPALSPVPVVDQYVGVTGVLCLENIGGSVVPAVRPRTNADVTIY